MRLASLQPSISITLAALGQLDALCACTRYCLEALPQLESRNLTILQDSWSFDRSSDTSSSLEALRATNPDLVLASVPYRLESLAAILKSGLPILTLAPHTLADIYQDIRLIAAVANAYGHGEAIVARMTSAIEITSRQAAASLYRPLVYSEEWGKPLIHSQSWVAELVAIANGTFLGTPGTHTTSESIAALPESEQPDVLLFAWCGAGNRVPLERVIAKRNWHHLRAVRNRRVFCVPDEFFNTPAPTLLEGLACIAAALHPTLFPIHKALIQLTEIHPSR